MVDFAPLNAIAAASNPDAPVVSTSSLRWEHAGVAVGLGLLVFARGNLRWAGAALAGWAGYRLSR